MQLCKGITMDWGARVIWGYDGTPAHDLLINKIASNFDFGEFATIFYFCKITRRLILAQA